MASTEYSNRLIFCLDETALRLRNSCRQSPHRSDLSRDLFAGSVPDGDKTFDPNLGVIGSGRPGPKHPASDWMRAPISDIKSENDGLAKPKVSKFAKSFPSPEPASPIPDHRRRQRVIISSRRHRLCEHGDMSNLRPDDRGMDAPTCFKFYHMSTSPEDRVPLVTTESNDGATTSGSKRITFDLGAQLAVPSTDERKARCRARGRELLNNEAAVTIHLGQYMSIFSEDSEEVNSLVCLHDLCNVTDGSRDFEEDITIPEGPEGGEDLEMFGSVT